jgi:hypothetical protein
MGESSRSMSTEIRAMGREIAVLGASSVAVAKLGESFGLLSKEQAGVIREMGSMVSLFGTVVRGLSYLADAENLAAIATHARGVASAFADAMSSGITKIAGGIISVLRAIASSSIAVTLAENARAIATAIANAVASLGIAVPIMIAAAAAAAVGIAAYTGAIKIPAFAEGGIVYKPTYALIGEKEPEIVAPLSKIMSWTSKSVSIGTIVINEAKTPRETGDAVVDALRRRGAI